MEDIVNIYTDGACRGNPGASSVGVFICNQEGNELERYQEYIGTKTNNIAEYQAVIVALDLAKKYTNKEVNIFSDSQLLVKQLTGEWKVKAPHIWDLLNQVRSKEADFKSVKYQHVRREFNKTADMLANQALDSL